MYSSIVKSEYPENEGHQMDVLAMFVPGEPVFHKSTLELAGTVLAILLEPGCVKYRVRSDTSVVEYYSFELLTEAEAAFLIETL